MKLLLVRHAIAEDAESSGAGADAAAVDRNRPEKKCARANRLRSQVDGIDVLACSPRLRARETAGIIARALATCRCWSVPNWILAVHRSGGGMAGTVPAEAVLAAVGHEPHLGLLSGLLLTAIPCPLIAFRKGGWHCWNFPAGSRRAKVCCTGY